MNRNIVVAIATLAIVVPLRGGGAAEAQQAINPEDFQPAITHPLFPLSLIGPKVFEGEEEDPETGDIVKLRLESRVLPQTEVVAGVTVTVLEEKDFQDGELAEVALDFFAQHRDGSVYYFGERVDNYENGQIKDHQGQWLAGEDGNGAGIIMPAQPQAGQTFIEENAPGIAEDRGTVLALNVTVSVPAGTYQRCMKTRDFTPLEPGIEEFKWYCPGVGLVKEEGEDSVNELVSIAALPVPSATAVATVTTAPAATPPYGIVAPSTGYGIGTRESGASRWLVAAAASGLLLALGGVLVLGGTLARRSALPELVRRSGRRHRAE